MTPANANEAQGTRAGLGGTFLTFRLAAEEYGVEILKVREIIGVLPITAVPRMPAFMLGVVNLRGRVIPVMDLRLKFDMPAREHTRQTCIVIVDVQREAEVVTMGVLVDEVAEVCTIAGKDISRTPAFGSSVDTRFILGIGMRGDRMVILLDLDKVLSAEEFSGMSRM